MSEELERSLLGCFMTSDQSWEKCVDVTKEDHFNHKIHREIFEVIKSLINNGNTADAVSITEVFEKEGKVRRINNGALITAIANNVISVYSARTYAIQLRDSWMDRESDRLIREVISEASSYEDRLKSMQNAVFMMEQLSASNFKQADTFANSMSDWFNRVEDVQTGKIKPNVFGIPKFDSALGGFLSGDQVVIAGRPSSGKTALALQACDVFLEQNKDSWVLIFSGEMSSTQLISRMVQRKTGISDPMRYKLEEHQWPHVTNAIKTIGGMNVLVDQTPAIDISDLVVRAMSLSRRYKIGMIIVDYLQLMKAGNLDELSKTTKCSQELKALAKKIGVPMLTLSQLNRASEKGIVARKPNMSDLRSSGAIEQDADIIIIVHTTSEKTRELIIPKSRFGVSQDVDVVFNGAYQLFRDFYDGEELEYKMDSDQKKRYMPYKRSGH